MNKKILLVIFATIILACLVSAASASADIGSFIRGFGEVIGSLFETILGPGPAGVVGGGLFARVLFLIVVFVIVYAVLQKIPMIKEKSWMLFTLSIAVALLSTRFLLEEGWVETVLLPYSVLGIALTAFLPLLIYFYFLEFIVESDILRKIGWIFAAVVFIGLWWGRYSDIDSNAIYIYPITALICLLFWWFNRPIQNLKDKLKRTRIRKQQDDVAISTLKRKLNEREEETNKAIIDAIKSRDEGLVRSLKKELNGIIEAMKELDKRKRHGIWKET